ncbi:enoyl-CoA hydratase/isomerase family protein, partial [Burkholderia gladioli]|nr:enoyl-CoA hydratase/isomerase family protein [Burkholderia gladioli]
GLDRALQDRAVTAIVLTGAGRAFSGGADITEFNTPKALQEPSLHTLIAAVEASAKPVVAAVHSVVMGGGLELALGAHYRIAAPGTQVALPEVKIGLLPGAGGTQRLPRALGLETALNMIVSGAAVPSEQLAKSGLFDEMAEGDLLEAAVALARRVGAKPGPHPRVRDRRIEHPNAAGFIQFARNSARAAAPQYPAPHKCIDAIEAG